MKFTSTSNITVQAKNLDLVFKTQLHKPWSLRDKFVETLRDPLSLLPNQKDRFYALREVSFSSYQGDRIGIIGKNGAGKTSLCRLIAGVYRASGGTLSTQGLVRSVFDTNVGIYPELTGRENVHLLLHYIYPQDVKEHQAMAEEIIDFSGLGSFADAPFRLYSNGMQARLCLSLISAKSSPILVLDEVFDGADQEFQKRISQRILKLVDSSQTAFFVSHSPEQIRQLCNRALVLSHGSLV
ncbi:MAG: ABC transporter ATP-binding protein, partial [Bdellovibrio sp.]|nr:ABC transporter ATP-binding protein [Bdellovibrio sp.]